MNIYNQFVKRPSKEEINQLATQIGNNQEKFDELVDVMLLMDTEPDKAFWASWVMGHIALKHPVLLNTHFKNFINLLGNKNLPKGIKRNILRALKEHKIPKSEQGLMVEYGFMILDDPREAIAARAFAMKILYHICLEEPDLSEELIFTIQQHLPNGSSAFKNQGKKIVKALG